MAAAIEFTYDYLPFLLGQLVDTLRLVICCLGSIHHGALLDGIGRYKSLVIVGIVSAASVLCEVELIAALATLEELNIGVDVHAMRPLDVHEELLGVAPDLSA